MMKIEDAKNIFKDNFIGPEKLIKLKKKLNFKLPGTVPDIDIRLDNIDPSKYILIFGCNQLKDSSTLNIKSLIQIFGFNYSNNNVCFYNQDWYLNESFATISLENKWYLIEKNIQDETRGVQPDSEFEATLPSAILCVYTFFIWWLAKGELLWPRDYVWCSDKDRYGDRIYVGKYIDNDNIKRSGFSIHRHLTIKQNYGSIKSI